MPLISFPIYIPLSSFSFLFPFKTFSLISFLNPYPKWSYNLAFLFPFTTTPIFIASQLVVLNIIHYSLLKMSFLKLCLCFLGMISPRMKMTLTTLKEHIFATFKSESKQNIYKKIEPSSFDLYFIIIYVSFSICWY